MMTRFKVCAALVLATLAVGPSYANDADRAVLRDRLDFIYVANGNTRDPAARLDNAQIYAGNETGAFWSNASIPGLHGIVRKLLRDSAGGGDDQLQYYVSRVVEIATDTRKVKVILFDDVTQTLNRRTARRNWGGCIKSSGHAWPCATHYGTGTYGGAMWLGAHYFAGANREKFATFLHETIHTQDRTDGRAHLFTISGGTRFRYGADDAHYRTELIPNRAMTYKEGLANALRLRYDASLEQHFFNVFATNDYLWVEKAEPPAGSGLSPDAWLHRQLDNAGVTPATVPEAILSRLRRSFRENYDAYRIHSLPPRFMVHNEYVIAMIIAKYLLYVDERRFFDAVRDVNATLFQASGSGIAVLFEALGAAGLPEGASLESSTVEGNGHMLPFAFADYFTGFRTTTKAQYAELFESMMPEAWINSYWDVHRQTVRAAVQAPSATRRAEQGDLTDIAISLGLTESRADD